METEGDPGARATPSRASREQLARQRHRPPLDNAACSAIVAGMIEDIEKLRATLARLQADVDSVETRDPEVRVMLSAALRRISDKLQGHPPEAEPATAPPDTSDLTLAAQKFEAEHPTLAATVRGVVDSLTTFGL